jgi:hypothetical protein
MSRLSKALATTAILSAAFAFSLAPHDSAADGGVKSGFIKCDVAGNLSFIVGSSRDVKCVFNPGNGKPSESYTGTIKKFGVDIGYQSSGVMVWGVIAPSNTMAPGALAGDYVGVSATVALGLGAAANALVGGYQNSIALQPLSVEGIEGLNIAGGVAGLTLTAAP